MTVPPIPKTRSEDPEHFDPSELREVGDFPRGHMTVRWGTKMISVPSQYAAGIFFAFILLILLGVFQKWGISSPLIPGRDSEQKEHLYIRQMLEDVKDAQDVANYVLSQCLQPGSIKDCPKLPKPKRILELEKRNGGGQ